MEINQVQFVVLLLATSIFAWEWIPSCDLFINEVKFSNHGQELENKRIEFVELVRLCEVYPKKEFAVNLKKFRLVFIDASINKIVISCKLEALTTVLPIDKKKSSKERNFFLLGTSDVATANIHITDKSKCESALNDNFFPDVKDTVVIIALLKTEGSGKLLSLESVGDHYFSRSINADVKTAILQTVVDFHSFSVESNLRNYPLIIDLYTKFHGAEKIQSILQELREGAIEDDKSFNRCCDHAQVAEITFFHKQPSPLAPNLCSESHGLNVLHTVFQEMDVSENNIQNNNDVSNTGEVVASTSSDTNVGTSSGSGSDTNVGTSSGSGSNTNTGTSSSSSSSSSSTSNANHNDVVSGSGASVIAMPVTTTHTEGEVDDCDFDNSHTETPSVQWADCTQFPTQSITQITEHQNDIIDTTILLTPEICTWAQYIFNELQPKKSQLICRMCTVAIKKKIIREIPSSSCLTKATKEEGFLLTQQSQKSGKSLRSYNSEKMKKHVHNKIHLMSAYYFKGVEKGLTGNELTNYLWLNQSPLRSFYKPTEQLFRAIFIATRLRLSFESFHYLADLLNSYGVDIGTQFTDKTGATRMTEFLSEQMRKELVAYLLKSKLKVSLLADSSTDIDGIDILCINLVVVDNYFNAKTIFYKYIRLTDSSAKGMFTEIEKSFTNDGLKQFLMDNLISIGTDGASVMRIALTKEISDWLNQNKQLTDQKNYFNVWCLSHEIEITYKHSFKPFHYIKELDEFMQKLYLFFSKKSYKNRQKLREVARDELDTAFTLKRLFNIRWSSNRYRCTVTILNHFKSIATALKEISTDQKFAKLARESALKLYEQITDTSRLLHIAFIGDVTELYKDVSLKLQRDKVTIIEKRRIISSLWGNINSLKDKNGQHLTKLLTNFECGTATKKIPCTIQYLETDSRTATLYGHAIVHRIPKAPQFSLQKDEYINELEIQLNFYFQPSVEDSFEIFDPTQLVHFLQTKATPIVQSKPSDAVLLRSGEDQAKDFLIQINRLLKIVPRTEADHRDLHTQYKTLITSVTKHPKFPEYKTKDVVTFWRYFKDSSSKITWTTTMSTLVQTSLAVASVTSGVERMFSYYNIVKTYSRFNLLPELVDALVRISYEQENSLDKFLALKYAILWSQEHTRADPGRSRKRKIPQEEKPDFTDPEGIFPYSEPIIYD